MNTARRAGGKRRQRTIRRKSPGSSSGSSGPRRAHTLAISRASRFASRGRPPRAPFRRAAARLAALLLRPPRRPISPASTPDMITQALGFCMVRPADGERRFEVVWLGERGASDLLAWGEDEVSTLRSRAHLPALVDVH